MPSPPLTTIGRGGRKDTSTEVGGSIKRNTAAATAAKIIAVVDMDISFLTLATMFLKDF